MTQQETRSTPALRNPSWVSQRVRYLVLRLTGVMLAVLVLGHFALTHIVYDVAATNAAFIAQRWSSALWVAWDGLMLGAAFAHGAAGLLVIVRDVRTGRSSRRIWLTTLLGLTFLLLILGAATLAYGAMH
jgi:succinate dehydrogenase hydrophobic anchor subunit